MSKLSVKSTKKRRPDEETPREDDDLDFLDEGVIAVSDAVADPEAAKLPGNVADIPISEILPNPWNPNVQNDKEFDMLVRRMREVGMISPIEVVPIEHTIEIEGYEPVEPGEHKYMILGGEHRWKAAEVLQWPTIPAVVLTDERFKDVEFLQFVTMQLNMIHGKVDAEKFLKMHTELRKKHSDEALQDLMGFTNKQQWKVLTKNIEAGLPKEARGEFRDKVKDARPDELGGIIQEILAKYGNDLRFNFMVFTFEDKEHIWVRLDDKNYAQIAAIAELCRSRALDINVVLDEAFRTAIEAFEGVKSDA